MLQEFRNHLSGLMAAATELRTEMPPAVALHLGAIVGDAEHNVQSLRSLLALVDASLDTVDPIISDLDEVVSRAIRIAAPALGRRVSITSQVGRKTGIKNCGSALECLLAALLVDLSRAGEGRQEGKAANDDAARANNLRLWADASRGSLEIELDSDGPRPAPGSWRFLLACDLAIKLGATITSPTDVAAYVVHFR